MTICAEFDGRSWASCTRGTEGCICGLDNPAHAAAVLVEHNRWRRGEDGALQAHPAAIGLALETAIACLMDKSGPSTKKD